MKRLGPMFGVLAAVLLVIALGNWALTDDRAGTIALTLGSLACAFLSLVKTDSL